MDRAGSRQPRRQCLGRPAGRVGGHAECYEPVQQTQLGHKSITETMDTYGHLRHDDEDRTRRTSEDLGIVLAGGDSWLPGQSQWCFVRSVAGSRRRRAPIGPFLALHNRKRY